MRMSFFSSAVVEERKKNLPFESCVCGRQCTSSETETSSHACRDLDTNPFDLALFYRS